jgi:glyoxylase-like metal-dependent hydrolase (beta-lactamase superfamily II)
MIRLGEFRIDRLVEHEVPFLPPAALFPDYDPAVLAQERELAALIDDASGLLRLSFHSFLLRTERHTVLIDACMGNDKERPLRAQAHRRSFDFLGGLAALGVALEQVDVVLCTHLHWDHVGWNTRLQDGRWIPTFPNARYVMARREYEYRSACHARGEQTMHDLAFADSVLPLIRAERAVLVEDDFALQDGVSLVPFAGHTPGNVAINLQSDGARGVFCGDVLHSPLQLARPDWSSSACADPVLSRAARRRLIERHADTQDLVLPAHFPAPSAGRIVRRGQAFGFDAYRG